jgi:hypothetical protein
MGKVEFLSHQVDLPVEAEKVFLFFYDLNNLRKLMPDQVVNWQSTEDSCSFDIKGMAHITLQRAETMPDKMVRIVSGPDNPIPLEITGTAEKITENKTLAWIGLSAELSPMLQLMVSGPLQNLVKIMADRLRAEF